jgi:hypothetical protein
VYSKFVIKDAEHNCSIMLYDHRITGLQKHYIHGHSRLHNVLRVGSGDETNHVQLHCRC